MTRLLRRGFLVLMLLGTAFITLSSLVYFDPDVLPPFVIEKLPVRFEDLWMFSLKAHVASALLSFPLCIALMTRWLQRRPKWHRWAGRITGLAIVGVLVPSGFVLALEAKGGTPVTVGFLLSGVIVLVGMIYGVIFARRRQMLAHSRAMRHVFAQMSVAVTSRAMLLALHHGGMDPDTAYVVALWIPVLASALVAEWASGRLHPAPLPFSTTAPRTTS